MSENIMPIYVISLVRATDRRAKMQELMVKHSLEFTFFDAITPDTMHHVEHSYNVKKALYKVGRTLVATEIACACSHLEMWRKLDADEKHDRYLILEDDIELVAGFKSLVSKMPIPQEPHLIRLDGLRKRKLKEVVTIENEYSLFKMSEGGLLTSGYIIHKSAVKPLLAYCKDMFFPIDNMMDYSGQHGVANYCIKPYPVISDQGNISTIGDRIKKYSIENNFLLRSSVRVWRFYFSLCKRFAEIKLLLSPKPKVISASYMDNDLAAGRKTS